jgi:hypothetical protein
MSCSFGCRNDSGLDFIDLAATAPGNFANLARFILLIFYGLMGSNNQVGLLLLGEMPPMDVQADDGDDGIIFHTQALIVRSKINTGAFRCLKPVASVEEKRLIVVIVLPNENGHPQPVRLDVLPELGEFIVRHHPEHIGCGMDPVDLAPLARTRCLRLIGEVAIWRSIRLASMMDLPRLVP